MRKRLALLLALVLLVVIGFAIYYQVRKNRDSNELILYGNVDVRQVDIGFRIAGQVEELFFEEGDYVQKGQKLATLNRTPYTSQFEQSKANVGSIRASLENADKLATRRQEVIGIGGVSRQDVDDALSNQSAQKANLQAAESALAVSEENLSYTEVYAPTDGVILTRVREPGTVVNPADPVYILSVSSPVWIRAYVSEVNLGTVKFGMPAEISIDTPNAPKYSGKIGFISPVAEFTPKTVETTQLRTDLVYRLRIYVENPDAILKQGMPVTVKLLTHES